MAMWRCFEILLNIYNSLSDVADDIVAWLDTTNVFGETYGELLFGSLLPALLGYAAVKWFADIVL